MKMVFLGVAVLGILGAASQNQEPTIVLNAHPSNIAPASWSLDHQQQLSTQFTELTNGAATASGNQNYLLLERGSPYMFGRLKDGGCRLMIDSKDSGLWQIRSLGPDGQTWLASPRQERTNKDWIDLPIPTGIATVEISRYDPGLNLTAQVVRNVPS